MTLSLERRVELGKKVTELITFIELEVQDKVSEVSSNFQLEQIIERTLLYDKLISELMKKLPKSEQSSSEELSIKQVQIFEEVTMPFGIHKDSQIKNVPYEYLCNLFDPNPFMKKLKKYLEYCTKYRYRG